MKRLIDIFFALIAAPLALAVIMPLSIIIRIDSKGPALFRQTRLGRNEKTFELFKLRTMSVAAPHVPSHEADNAMITSVGHVLRRLKLDELPQIWNVLVGDMSLVGPRPCLTSQHELIIARRALGVFSVQPGITGLAQVTGVDMSSPEKLAQVDHAYIRKMSVITDARLLIATALGKGNGDAVF
jgi:O-antigen biosynthesis protein WbqP